MLTEIESLVLGSVENLLRTHRVALGTVRQNYEMRDAVTCTKRASRLATVGREGAHFVSVCML